MKNLLQMCLLVALVLGAGISLRENTSPANQVVASR
ncbi:hypothetical protein QO010_000038 [Caulobacter ginsengisoli]|uniref:Uncharacterized protein n=1 Tax=Caulobacter ginsengisoli TaxID=400775 RepID=A0ABU0IJW0_9CAUL|nr:hypothetical protein [Caulobacter ginsengisoli]